MILFTLIGTYRAYKSSSSTEYVRYMEKSVMQSVTCSMHNCVFLRQGGTTRARVTLVDTNMVNIFIL